MDSVGVLLRQGGTPHAEPTFVLTRAGGCKAQTPSGYHVAIFPVRASIRQVRQLKPRRACSSIPAGRLFYRSPVRRVKNNVRSTVGTVVNGNSHGKGNGIGYAFAVARFWCVATCRAWQPGTTCRPQTGLDGQQQAQRIRVPGWLS